MAPKEATDWDNEREPGNLPVSFGISLSNKANADNNPMLALPENLPAVFQLASRSRSGMELQLEPDGGPLHIPQMPEQTPGIPFIGVHLPIIGIDLTSTHEPTLQHMFTAFDESIQLATFLQADYVNCHLQGNLNWENIPQREKLIETMEDNAEHIAALIHKNDFRGTLLFENLEFPLYPATAGEIVHFLTWINTFEKRTQISTGLCIDLSHLWHSGILIAENAHQTHVDQYQDEFSRATVNFPEYFRTLLDFTDHRIEVFHITGASVSSVSHDTHRLPTVSNPLGDLDRREMNIGAPLQAIFEYSHERPTITPIVNEAHGTRYADMIHANTSLQHFLEYSYADHAATREHLHSPLAYYQNPEVIRAMLSFLGADGTTWDGASHIKHAYMGVGYAAKQKKGKTSPLSTIPPQDVSRMILNHHGYVELHASLLPRASKDTGGPERALLIWDLDRYRVLPDSSGGHNFDEATPILTPSDTFEALEPVIALYWQAFDALHIPVMTTLSGKGVHFISEVTDESALEALAVIGGPVEDTLAGKLATAPLITKSPDAIPEVFQQTHIGAGILHQLINMYLIQEARNRLSPFFSAEIFNKGFPFQEVNGIAFDNSAATFPVYLKPISVPGSLYFIKVMKSGLDFPNYSIQLPISGNGYRHHWQSVIHYRDDFSSAASYLSTVDCHVPNAGRLDKLLRLYADSDLRQLHQAMDQSMGDPVDLFNDGYRKDNYRLVNDTHDAAANRRTVDFAPAFLGGTGMQYYYLDTLIFQIFEAMGGSYESVPHVAGFLRALYEDPYKNWGGLG